MLISEFRFFERKAHTRRSKSGKSVPVKKSRIKGRDIAIAGGVGIGAGLAGLALMNRKAIQTGLMMGGPKNISKLGTIAKNPLVKRNYQRVAKQNLIAAQKLAKTIDLPEGIDPTRNSATFIVGGFSGFGENALQEAQGLGLLYRRATRNKNYHAHIPEHFNVKNNMPLKDILAKTNEDYGNFIKKHPNLTDLQKREIYVSFKEKAAAELFPKPLQDEHTKAVGDLIERTFIKSERNKDVEILLAKILKSREANPKLEINLIGSSGGGFTTQEVAQHLDTLKIPYRQVTVGTPDLGVVNHNKYRTKGVIGERDTLFNRTPIYNKVKVKGGINHDSKDYFTDPTVINLFKNFLKK